MLTLDAPKQVHEILDTFASAGYEIYIVGGVVRDALLKRPLDDWDFTTSAIPEEIQKLYPDSFYDNKYGTVGIKNDTEGRPYEVTTFRTDHGYSDSRHPDKVVWGKTLEQDLARRDFTINAMALKKLKSKDFEVVDYYKGLDDLEKKLISAVGVARDRFTEDALRMMRAVRLAAQLGFTIEGRTLVAIQQNASRIQNISAERIRDELLKLMASDYSADGYLILRSTGLASEIFPEMETTFGVEQKSPGRHHIYDVGTHSVESLRATPSRDPITRLATLIHDVGKAKTQRVYPDGKITFYNHEMESAKIAVSIADRLRFSKAEKEKFVRLVRWHQFSVDDRQTDSAVRRFLRNVGRDNLSDMLDLRIGDRLGGGARRTSWRLEEFKDRLVQVQKQPFAIPDLKITGHDVIKIKKVPSGPQVGKYLETLFKEVVEKNLPNERESLLKKLNTLP